ncbi:MAG: hypothetical protein WD231_03780 [Candidatus Woykebacteria bacterium]
MSDLNQVITILRENKVADDEIAQFVVNSNNLIAEKMMVEITMALDERDASEIDKMSDAQGQEEVYKRFREKTGKDIEDVRSEVVDAFVSGFLTKYHQDKLQGKKE